MGSQVERGGTFWYTQYETVLEIRADFSVYQAFYPSSANPLADNYDPDWYAVGSMAADIYVQGRLKYRDENEVEQEAVSDPIFVP